MAASTQKLVDNEQKVIYKFHSDVTETDVKKVDVSTLNWANHTLTLSDASTENFKIGEVITTAATEHFIVTGFTAGASTVTVVGWDNTNKKATAIDSSMSSSDVIVGGVSGSHTETVAGSGNFTELDYNLIITKLQWITNGLNVVIEWDGGTSEAVAVDLSGNGSWNCGSERWPGIPMNAVGDSGNVLGDIQFSTIGHSSTDSYTIWLEARKDSNFDPPAYEQNSVLGFPVDYVLGNFT